jgi:hypothetical protein
VGRLLGWLVSMAESGLPRTPNEAIRGFILLLALGSVLEAFSAFHHDQIFIGLGFLAAGAILAILDFYWTRICGLIKFRGWHVAALLMLLSIFSFSAGAIWHYFSGPKGESFEVFDGPSVIGVSSMDAALRNPATDIPFLANIHFKSDKDLIDVASWGYLVVTGAEMSPVDLDPHFHAIHALLMSLYGNELSSLPANENRFLSVEASGALVVTDDDVRQVTSGNRDIYVLYSWRYRLPGRSKIFMKDFCAFYEGNFTTWHYCPGTHNGTFVAR